MDQGPAAFHQTPLHDWHLARGARMVDFAGWAMPIHYTTITEEHQAVRGAAGLFDISHMGRLLFEGPGALDLIQWLYTNDAATMKPGQIRYGLVCNERGGIRDDVLVYRLPASWLMVVNASNRTKILDWIAQQRGRRDVRVTDQTFTTGMIALQGPRAADIIGACSGGVFRDAGSLKYYHGQVLAEGAESLLVSRTGYTGEDGVEVIAPASRLRALTDDIFATAERLGLALKPCGLGARDTLRLEAAMPLYGHELTEDIDPFQAGLGWAVKMEKGEFQGRAALEARRQDSRLRRRVGLELEGKRIAREGARVLHANWEIGQVTSGTFTPTLGRAVAMAYVDPDWAQPGLPCEVDVRGKPAPARVVPLPFYRKPS